MCGEEMASIKDVAEYAGVSTSTVSRVLSGKIHVNDETREKVFAGVHALGYKPNLLAKSLKMGRTDTIALIVPSIQNQIFPVIARGVEDTARKNGFTTILCNTDEDVDIEKMYINKLRTRWIDGIIIGSMLPDSTHINKLREEGFPIVLASRYYDKSIDAITIDHYQAAYDGTSYLIRTGHKRIAVALGRRELNVYRDRFAGYLKALEDHGLSFDPELLMEEQSGASDFYYLTRNLLSSGKKPDAIFATSDPKAVVILRALKDAGVSVPEEVSVLGIDNIEIAALIEPPLSTVSQPLYDIGAIAAQKLLGLITHKDTYGVLPEPTIDILSADLIIRKSTR